MLTRRQKAAFCAAVMLFAAVPARAETIHITIEKLVFVPASVTAKAGDTIEWKNRDVMAHSATVDGAWDVLIPPGKSATVVAKQAGSLDYYCRFHPNMRGHISVDAP